MPFGQTALVKLTNLLVLLALAALGAGCGKTNTSKSGTNDASSSTNDYFMPTHAQAKLQTIPIYLGAQTLNAELALTPTEQATGLMYRTNITDQTAMLFVMGEPLLPPEGFWMTNCPISLSAAYIGPDGVIEEIHHLEKNDNVPVMATNNNVIYVLEVNDGWFARHNIGVGTLIRTDRGSFADTFRR